MATLGGPLYNILDGLFVLDVTVVVKVEQDCLRLRAPHQHLRHLRPGVDPWGANQRTSDPKTRQNKIAVLYIILSDNM